MWRVLLYLFGLPFCVFSFLLVLRLEWFSSLNLFVVFIPLWIMDCMHSMHSMHLLNTHDLVVLTLFLLGPAVVEMVRQTVIHNIRGIIDVSLSKEIVKM